MQQVFRVALTLQRRSALDCLGEECCFNGANEGVCWRLWLHTPDYIHGTYLLLHYSGKVERVTVRADEGDEIVLIKE